VNKNKPDEKYIKFISYVEETYECSGMCTPSLFYLTQSVEKGLPKQGCVKPFVQDVSDLFFELGATMIASGVLFLFMIIIICPICCFDPKYTGKNRKIEAYMNSRRVHDSGSIEMSDRELNNDDTANNAAHLRPMQSGAEYKAHSMV
jgi:hypothetical protein